MLTPTLRRTHIELQSHRQWLSVFLARCYRDLHTTSHTPNHFNACHIRSMIPSDCQHIPLSICKRSYKTSTTNTVRRPKFGKPRTDRVLSQPILKAVYQLQEALQHGDIFKIIASYNELPPNKIGLLNSPRDTQGLVTCLVTALDGLYKSRTRQGKSIGELKDALVVFADQLVHDIKIGTILPSRLAAAELLAFYQKAGLRDSAIEFWEFLRSHDKSMCSTDVYGRAIEVLAAAGRSLLELEALFAEALERYPDYFAAYHYSPNSVTSNRENPFNNPGLKPGLLQGIAVARLLNGNSKDAYLALDTALRLFPRSMPASFIIPFLEERPLSEAYAVFAMACRTKIRVPYEGCRNLVTALRNGIDVRNPAFHVSILRQIISILCIYDCNGGIVTPNLINEVVIAITQTMRLYGLANISPDERAAIVSSVQSAVTKTLAFAARRHIKPGMSSINAIITNVAGHGRNKDIIAVALQDARSLDLQPTVVTSRSILTAAGLIGDVELVQNAWESLVAEAEVEGLKPSTTDFNILIHAGHRTRQVGFARSMVEKHRTEISEDDWERLRLHLDAPEPKEDVETAPPMDTTVLLNELKRLEADIDHYTSRSSTFAAELVFDTLPMTIAPPVSNIPAAQMRQLYDELTMESVPMPGQRQELDASSETQEASELQEESSENSAETETSDAQGDVNSTGIESASSKQQRSVPTPLEIQTEGIQTKGFFGKLRYENWKTINHLLALAEENDAQYDRLVDEAIARSVPPPSRHAASRTFGIPTERSYGLSDCVGDQVEDDITADPAQIQSAKENILRLRDISPATDSG